MTLATVIWNSLSDVSFRSGELEVFGFVPGCLRRHAHFVPFPHIHDMLCNYVPHIPSEDYLEQLSVTEASSTWGVSWTAVRLNRRTSTL